MRRIITDIYLENRGKHDEMTGSKAVQLQRREVSLLRHAMEMRQRSEFSIPPQWSDKVKNTRMLRRYEEGQLRSWAIGTIINDIRNLHIKIEGVRQGNVSPTPLRIELERLPTRTISQALALATGINERGEKSPEQAKDVYLLEEQLNGALQESGIVKVQVYR